MNGNTEPSSNSIKFAPMPMSALLANLEPLQSREDSPDCSFSSGDESDGSFGQTVAKKQSPVSKADPKCHKITNKDFITPNVKSSQPMDVKAFVSEKKPVRYDQDKENTAESWKSHQTYPNKNGYIQNTPKNVITTQPPSTEVKKRSVLVPHNYVRTQSSAFKKTPEVANVPSHIPNLVQKTKTPTPKIKTGIRRFTPGSARKSKKKTPQKTLEHNRDRVRCELFTQNQQKDEPPCRPLRPEPMPAPTPVPETPMNRKPMPMSYAATPSYPQGVGGNYSKKLFKTTIIKDKKYMFIKMLGKGGSSEVYKVN